MPFITLMQRMTDLLPNFPIVASLWDAVKEDGAKSHTAEPNGFLYGVVDI